MSCTLTAEEIITATCASLRGPEAGVKGVGTDSRVDLKGQLFVALKGERYDGHEFVAQAIQNGAVAVMVHDERREYEALKSKCTFYVVGNTLTALQDLARHWRRKNAFQVVGITGSNGKTSSKELTYQILKDFKPTVASQGSFNNHWGVPLSILSAPEGTKILVLEMGMNHLGELTALAEIAEPDVTAVTMVGRSHVGELGSQHNIAKAKEELYLASPRSVAIFNMDNTWTSEMFVHARIAGTHSRLITFSSHNTKCDVSIRAETMTAAGLKVAGQIGGTLGHADAKVFGRHNVNNLMVAASVAWVLGMPSEAIWKKMDGVASTAWGRNQWLKLPSGADVLFDAYNANPESMTAMLKNVYELENAGKKLMVLGEMLELGEESPRAHRELGELTGKIGPDLVWFLGAHYLDFETGLRTTGYKNPFYCTPEFDPEISNKIKGMMEAKDIVALKASRGQKLEKVLEHWGLKP